VKLPDGAPAAAVAVCATTGLLELGAAVAGAELLEPDEGLPETAAELPELAGEAPGVVGDPAAACVLELAEQACRVHSPRTATEPTTTAEK
jgi:hypothetical protein